MRFGTIELEFSRARASNLVGSGGGQQCQAQRQPDRPRYRRQDDAVPEGDDFSIVEDLRRGSSTPRFLNRAAGLASSNSASIAKVKIPDMRVCTRLAVACLPVPMDTPRSVR